MDQLREWRGGTPPLLIMHADLWHQSTDDKEIIPYGQQVCCTRDWLPVVRQRHLRGTWPVTSRRPRDLRDSLSRRSLRRTGGHPSEQPCSPPHLSAVQNARMLVSWSLTSLFSTNMAISETKGQGWKVTGNQWRKASDILTSTLAAFLFSSHPKKGKGSRGSFKLLR